MIYDPKVVFENGPEDIQARMDTIRDTIDELINLQTAVQSEGYWCSGCQRWYYKTECKLDAEEKVRTVCSNPFDGYLDKYRYEEVTDYCIFHKCPKGHKVTDMAQRG